jgi:biopolymer transport protein ExbD
MLKRRKRPGVQEINAGSMADIAFLLLIFFLVTTTMDTDAGIMRLLPPIVEDNQDPEKVNDRDVYVVLINDADQLLVEGENMDIQDLRAGAKEFMTNPGNLENLPQKRSVTAASCRTEIANYQSYVASAPDEERKQEFQKGLERAQDKLRTVELIGEFMELPGNAVISLQTGSKTSYDMYVRVQNELEAGIRELRDELSKEKFNRKFSELDDKNDDDKDLIKAIRLVYPQRISEAEPVDVTKKQS